MAAVYGTCAAFALYIVMTVRRFDFITAYITANSISNDHFDFLLWGDSLEGIDGVFGFNDQIIITCHAYDIGQGNPVRTKGIVTNIDQQPAALPGFKIHDLALSTQDNPMGTVNEALFGANLINFIITDRLHIIPRFCCRMVQILRRRYTAIVREGACVDKCANLNPVQIMPKIERGVQYE